MQSTLKSTVLCYFLSGRLNSFSFIRGQSLFIGFGPGRHRGKFTVKNFSSQIIYMLNKKKQIELTAKIINYQA